MGKPIGETKEQIKKMYIDDKLNINEICISLGITKQNFHYHRKEDKKKGINWDELRLANIQSKKEAKLTYNQFLANFIVDYEKKIKETQMPIEQYWEHANMLIKLKNPMKDCNQERISASNEAINRVMDIARKHKREDVRKFLQENAEEIVSKINKN